MRPQERVIVDVERVPMRPRWMRERLVERVEVVPHRLYLACVDDLVAEPAVYVLDLAPKLRKGMVTPSEEPRARTSVVAIAELYDPWSASVVEDVAFYLEEARKSGGPVVELGVGTGRIAVPVAADGIRVIGIDSSRGMLDVCARRAALAGVELDLRVGDLRNPPVRERVPLVICPFRSYLHLHTDDERRRALTAAHRLLPSGGRPTFDRFAPPPG